MRLRSHFVSISILTLASVLACASQPAGESTTVEAAASEPAEAAAGAKAFDRAAATAALSDAAEAARSCKGDGPTGKGKIEVTFAPSGDVTSAIVDAPFAGTPVGGCVSSAFQTARVPPFEGAAVSMSKSFDIE